MKSNKISKKLRRNKKQKVIVSLELNIQSNCIVFRTQLERTTTRRIFNVIKNIYFRNLEKYSCKIMQSISQWQNKKQLNYKVNFMRNLSVPKIDVVLMPLKMCCCNKSIETQL